MPEEPASIWLRPERGARGPAPERSRAQIAAVAIDLADAGGLAAVSTRQIAKALGTGPASLYRYVATRDDLIDLMHDAVTGEVDLSVPLTGDPIDDLLSLAARTRDLCLRHPWLLDVPVERTRLGPRAADYLEYALRALQHVPMTGRRKLEAISLLNGLVMLFAQLELQERRTPTARQAAQAAYRAQLAADGRHPLIAAAMAGSSLDPPEDPGQSFERMTRQLLAGLGLPG
ncbi:TetR/AcrR family transcriptional regulator C-terminal domain-containing protein [Nonomuraea sp. SMC257]|uniref:TetR/AcrR family transcriptional regulator C-terminal domain-containing protein n=1 Tax=Nonomuraea montanisoli TaxID=2741721 RepID=A0A7Y6I6A0_9ACTN|nr:TetR/AcrR family transcriptional regulator [Nonomuraea montanisoli]NUW32366.1 TetR/AcrR family transcriptional regulator C-terminal domain-containing protein [Nonomuraea montanisoli]